LRFLHTTRVAVATTGALLALGAGLAGSALATGQPGAKAGNHCGEVNPTTGVSAEMTPGKSGSAGGSPFNPAGTAGEHYAGNPGTSSLEHSARPEIAESQYDVACVNATNH
jgi:hypothetical protein